MIKITEHKISFFDDTETVIIPVVQGDTGRVLKFTPTDATLSASYTATWFVRKPSKNAVYYNATITGNSVICGLTAQALAEKGDSYLNVRIYDQNEDVVSAFRVVLKVQESPVDAIESTTETNIFDQTIEDAKQEIGQILDTTLSIQNKAAEAKAVGDALVWDKTKYSRPAITSGTGEDSILESGATAASAIYSHAEGFNTSSTNQAAHAEGISTLASGLAAHAEGRGTEATGTYSHAEGYYTTASGKKQHVVGEYNVADPYDEYVEIVGNGTGNDARSNARTVDWSGNEVLKGKLTVGTAPTADMDVATKKYVDDASSGVLVSFSDPNHDGHITVIIGGS